jgi:hypothetical protein
MKRLSLALAALCLVVLAPGAHAFGKGTQILAVQVTNGTADFADPTASGRPGFVSAWDHSEVGIQGQYWNMLTDDYAVVVSGGYGFFSETDKPGTLAGAGATDQKYTQSSYSVRIGGDRVVKVGERAILYFGPGFEYWNGSAKFERFSFILAPATTYENQATSRFSFSGRIGGMMSISRNVGLACHVGHKVGYATVEEGGAKATWWPSSFDGAAGFYLSFGGD